MRSPGVSVVFVCHDGTGRVLLARRAAGARDEPGTWDTGAGALEYGETFEDAVAREVREEYRADVRAGAGALTTLGVRNVLRRDSHWVAVVFAVEVDPAAVAIGEPHKFDRLDWFDPSAPPVPAHSQLAQMLALFAPHRPAVAPVAPVAPAAPRHVSAGDPAVRAFLERHDAAVVARRGELVDATTRPALVAGDVDGVLTYDVDGDACEILTLHADRRWGGTGTALVEAVATVAADAGCRTLWVLTTNDNVDALRFYQRRGFRLAALRPGAVDESRRTLKPQIPPVGAHEIPLSDEIELVRQAEGRPAERRAAAAPA